MCKRKRIYSSKEQRSAVILLMSLVVLGVFPLDVLLPSFPALADYLHTSTADIAFSISLFAIGISLSQLFIGPLSDTIGRKNLLLAGIILSIIGAAGCILSSEYAWFLTFRVIQAIGCGSFVLSQALVQDLFQGQDRNRLRIQMVTASGVFICISPLLGSLLQQALDWPGSFLVFIALAAAVFLKTLHLLEQKPPIVASTPQGIFNSYRQVCFDANYMGYWLIAAFAFTCHFSFIVYSPLIFMEHLNLTTYEFSLTLLYYGMAYVVGGLAAQTLAKCISPHIQIVVGLSLISFSGLVMLLLSYWLGLSPMTVLLPMIICTAGTTIARPIATSLAMDRFPSNAGTSASVGNTMVFTCGGVISAAINPSVNDLQITLAFVFLMLSITGLIINAFIGRRRPPAGL